MPGVSLSHRAPAPEELIRLREAVGWPVPDIAEAKRAMETTLFGVTLRLDGRCIGGGRVVGDGSLAFFIQDVIVMPNMQGNGYGTLIMDGLMEYINRHARHGAFVGLFAAKGMETWYTKYGFISRPNDDMGCGMMFQRS